MFFEVKKSSFSSRFFSQIAPLSSLEESVEPEVFHSQTFKQTNQNSFLETNRILMNRKKPVSSIQTGFFSILICSTKKHLFRIFRKIGFRSSADRTLPVSRDVFERGSGLYATIRIAFCRIIDPTTAQAFVLF